MNIGNAEVELHIDELAVDADFSTSGAAADRLAKIIQDRVGNAAPSKLGSEIARAVAGTLARGRYDE